MTEEQKRYDPKDSTLKFVSRKDDITLDDDPNILRAEMPCGHAVTPQSLTAWCRSLLDQGQYKFLCPALKDGTTQKCGAVWPYVEVRRMALLTQEEQSHFEETMAVLAAAEYCEYNSCPGCKSFVERQDLTNLCVLCTICTAESDKRFEFCWQCFKEWKGPGPRSDRCDNSGCINPHIEKLLKCRDIILHEADNIRCPSMRACPTCGNLLEHDTTGCKNIICNRCQVEFCFSCLKLTSACLRTSSHFIPCRDGVAPRQTSIPCWRK
ncbi:probable E3 ubiquitin-protein ligase RNF144A-A [Electrophorus electricus]|uniref:RING-type domain-containing protein n=1 Tax=Electrophorus electricus TaxID=8005 RepID=A0A4W4GUY1_ELEEL|nr:probable E3 ubiquitin-protein ligase RNF144A-A [Electrophorus electricus]